MERFIPLENFRKKSKTVRSFFPFWPKRPKFFCTSLDSHHSGHITSLSARLPVEAEGEKWRSFPRRVMVFCKWYNSNTFLFSETFSSPVPFVRIVRNFLPKFRNRWQTFLNSPRFFPSFSPLTISLQAPHHLNFPLYYLNAWNRLAIRGKFV